jgi:hypothetical protein
MPSCCPTQSRSLLSEICKHTGSPKERLRGRTEKRCWAAQTFACSSLRTFGSLIALTPPATLAFRGGDECPKPYDFAGARFLIRIVSFYEGYLTRGPFWAALGSADNPLGYLSLGFQLGYERAWSSFPSFGRGFDSHRPLQNYR